jgi:hypothetical protein
MSKRVVPLVLVVVVVVGGLWIRHYFSPAEVVKRSTLAVIADFESERILAVMAKISRSYSDPWGQSYESVAGNLRELMETYDDLRVDVELFEPEVGEGEVYLPLSFVLSGRVDQSQGYVLGSLADPCTATLLWRDEQSGWKLASTEKLDIPELRDELEAARSDQ